MFELEKETEKKILHEDVCEYISRISEDGNKKPFRKMNRKNGKCSMKKKLVTALIALSICTTGVLWVSTEQTNEPVQEQTVTSEKFTPTPLVIETTKEPEPIGVYYGTVVITGKGIEGGDYEGLMLITMDGEYIRITCTDAIRSRFGDYF